jgi:hypothetical protein
MADSSFGASVVIDKPIEAVFDFLANGENDKEFSPRVLEIAKANPGAPALGAVYRSTVKDAGMKSRREFELTEFERPTRIRRHGAPSTPSSCPRAAMTSSRTARAPS